MSVEQAAREYEEMVVKMVGAMKARLYYNRCAPAPVRGPSFFAFHANQKSRAAVTDGQTAQTNASTHARIGGVTSPRCHD